LASKRAVVADALVADRFQIRDARRGNVVYEGRLSPQKLDPDSGDLVRTIDFSPLTVEGEYAIEIEGIDRSASFRIGEAAYREAFETVMAGFYGQRCGCAVDLGPRFPGLAHPPCHLQDADFHVSSGREGRRDASGGWHDAGDYGKYTVVSAFTASLMLWTWEWYSARIAPVRLDIPESENEVPDFLDEVKWGLDWMLSMQDDDGGVWHKLSGLRFDGFVMPQVNEKRPRYIIGTNRSPYKTTAATADYAATLAIASRVFARWRPREARDYLVRANKAFEWAISHPDVAFIQPSDVRTGVYPDENLADELLWAAAELFCTTGEPAFNQYFLQHLPNDAPWVSEDHLPRWSHVQSLALWRYALCERPGPGSDVRARIRRETIDIAWSIAARHDSQGHLHSLRQRDYVWSSNALALGYSMLLLVAHRFEPNAALEDAAWDNLHYILGRNPFGVSWVTRVGTNPFRFPHHRPSAADNIDEPWPGLLAGGPNAGRNDSALTKTKGLPPGQAWVDEQKSFSGNEIAINWNALLLLVLTSTLPQEAPAKIR